MYDLLKYNKKNVCYMIMYLTVKQTYSRMNTVNSETIGDKTKKRKKK